MVVTVTVCTGVPAPDVVAIDEAPAEDKVVTTVTVCTGVPAPDVVASDEAPVENEAAAEGETASVELKGPLTNLPPMILAFWLAAPALLFR
mgnify:CR=1 FL=1